MLLLVVGLQAVEVGKVLTLLLFGRLILRFHRESRWILSVNELRSLTCTLPAVYGDQLLLA